MTRAGIPPSDLQAEKSLLGACMLSQSALIEVLPILDPGDFYAIQHQSMYLAITLLHAEGVKVDPLLVRARCVQLGAEIADETIADMLNVTPSTTNAKRYAAVIVKLSRLRRVAMLLSQVASEAMDPTADPDELIGRAAEAQFDRLAAAREIDIDGLYTMHEFMQLADEWDTSTPWVIPDIMRKKWRCIIIAEEGAGKFTFLMQIALLISNGYDPFDLSIPIVPQRVLIVNAENPTEAIAHQAKLVNSRARLNLPATASEYLHIWHVEQGIDLLSRRDQARLDRVVSDTQPDLIVMGPLYKMFSHSNRTMEEDTKRMITFLDDIRVRHEVALMIEHHAPKGENPTRRDLFPGGSSLWMRWPEIGLAMKTLDRNEKGEMMIGELDRFRGDRLPADWPARLERGTEFSKTPWVGVWDDTRKAVIRQRIAQHHEASTR